MGSALYGKLTVQVMAANVIVTYVLKDFFKWACGRYWPITWQGSKPSLIATGDYGFNPFHVGPAFTAFPSGHAALVFSIISILWLCYPRWRWAMEQTIWR